MLTMNYQTALNMIENCPKANDYAKSYARAGRGMTGHVAKVQALYILNNITHWRGPDAKAVRTFLKEFSKSAR